MNDKCEMCGRASEFADDIISGMCDACFAGIPAAVFKAEFALTKIPMSVIRAALEERGVEGWEESWARNTSNTGVNEQG